MNDTTNAEYAALRDLHLSEMKDWIEGRRSWTNLGPHEPYTPDVIAAMDAQEVVKHAAAAAAFGALAAAMSDTPDVLDAQWLPADLLWIAPHLRRLSALGYVVVKAPGLSHGDELEQVEIDPITGEIGTQAAWVRRSAPENGE